MNNTKKIIFVEETTKKIKCKQLNINNIKDASEGID